LEALTTKIDLAVAWAEVYGAKGRQVLKASSGFAKGFLNAVFRLKVERLEGRRRDLHKLAGNLIA
jgi:hypothetical protein